MKTATKYYFHQNKRIPIQLRALDQKLKQTLKNANTQLIAVFVEVVLVATNVVRSVLYLGVESTFVSTNISYLVARVLSSTFVFLTSIFT